MVLNRSNLVEMDLNAFKRVLKDAKTTFTSLGSLRGYLTKQEPSDVNAKKIRFVQNLMKEYLGDTGRCTRRRVPGTGDKVIVKIPYKDTPDNRKAGRVGQTWDKVVYENAEYSDYTQKKMRRYRIRQPEEVGADGKPVVKKRSRTLWIEALEQAKHKLNAPNFVVYRKDVKDPNDPEQVLGQQVYNEAMQILAVLKEKTRSQEETQQKDHAPPPVPPVPLVTVSADSVAVKPSRAKKTEHRQLKRVKAEPPAAAEIVATVAEIAKKSKRRRVDNKKTKVAAA